MSRYVGWTLVLMLGGCAARDDGAIAEGGGDGSADGGGDAATGLSGDSGQTEGGGGTGDADDGVGDADDGMGDADDGMDDADDGMGDDGPEGPPGYHCDTMEAFCPVSLPAEGSPCCEDGDGQWCCDAPEGSECWNFCFAGSFGCFIDTCQADGSKHSLQCVDGVWSSTAAECRCQLDCGSGQLCIHTSMGCGAPDCVPPPPTEECVALPAECNGVATCDCAADTLCPFGECTEEGAAIICEIAGA